MAKKPSLAEKVQGIMLGYGVKTSLYPEWEAEQEVKQAAEPALPQRIRQMHKRFGTTPDKTCGTCKLCIRSYRAGRDYSRNYYKCLKTNITHGAATDWRVSWPACGEYNERLEKEGNNILDTQERWKP